MAKGGEAKSFCSKGDPHKKDCQYFADGTPDQVVSDKDFVPDSQTSQTPPGFIPDSQVPQVSQVPAGVIPDSQFKPDDKVQEAAGSNNPGFVPDSDFKSDEEKYSTTGQGIAARAESFGKGFLGPIPTAVELGLSKLGVPNVSAEDIKGREGSLSTLENIGWQGAGLAAGLAVPVAKAFGLAGNVAKLSQAATGAFEIEKASAIGAKAIQGAIQGGLLQASDNTTKAMLGEGDPGEPVSGILAKGMILPSLIGGALGATSGLVSKGLEAAANNAAGNKFFSFLAGIGETANGVVPENSYAKYLEPKAYDMGQKLWNNKVGLIGAGYTLKAGHDIQQGFSNDDLAGGAEDAITDLAKGFAWTLGAKTLGKPAGAALLKAISNGEKSPAKLFQIIDYANHAESGLQSLTKGIQSMMTGSSQQLSDKFKIDQKARDRVDQWLQDGGMNQNLQQMNQEQLNQEQPSPQGFAEGGEVKKKGSPKGPLPSLMPEDDPIANHFPSQNILLNTAKGRIAGYLNSVRPQQNMPKLAFDAKPDQRAQQKNYNSALDIALKPMSLLAKIQNGTIEPSHIEHFNAMYPDLGETMKQKITEQITHAQLKGTKPNSKIRQGLSLLMGTALSSEYTPQGIMAAQAVFQTKQQPPPQQSAPAKGPSKKSTSSLSKSSQSFLTGSQSAVSRQQD